MKRLIDIIVSASGLLLTAPLVLLAALAIRWETPGRSLFRQQRIGKHERPFTCFKLRTMFVETGNRPTHEIRGASVTRVGALLRRFKIDELPQLFNVLRGDMSLVGPRPCLPIQTDLIEARRKRDVFSIYPGITGLAQVQGIDMSDAERLATIDAQYVKSQSLLLDLKLAFATLSGKGIGKDHVAV